MGRFYEEYRNVVPQTCLDGTAQIEVLTSRKARIVWLLFLFIFGTYMAIDIGKKFYEYFQGAIQTNSKIENRLYPFRWPDVTICNPAAPYTFSSSELNSTYQEYYQYSEKHIGYKYMQKLYVDDYHTAAATSILDSTLAPSKLNFFQDNNYHVLALKTYDSYLSGVYDAHMIPDTNIRPTKFPYIFKAVNTPCRTFEIGNHSIPKGVKTIRLVVYSNFEDQIRNRRYFASSGLDVYVHTSKEYPNQMVHAQPGFTTSLTLTEVTHHYEPDLEVQKKCLEEQEVLEEAFLGADLKPYRFGITRDLCQSVINQIRIQEACRCLSPMYPYVLMLGDNIPMCLNGSLFATDQLENNVKCMEKYNSQMREEEESAEGLSYKHINIPQTPSPISSNDLPDETFLAYRTVKRLQRKCKHLKLPRCERNHYTLSSTSYMRVDMWNSAKMNQNSHKYYRDFLERLKLIQAGQKVTDEFIRRSLYFIELHRKSDYGDTHEYSYAKKWTTVVGEIGSSMDLCFGLSVIGLAEILLFILTSFSILSRMVGESGAKMWKQHQWRKNIKAE